MFPKYSTQWQQSIIFTERRFCTYLSLCFISLHLFYFIIHSIAGRSTLYRGKDAGDGDRKTGVSGKPRRNIVISPM